MDPVSPAVGALIERVGGSAVGELNAALTDEIRAWRVQRQLRVLEKLEADLASKGRSARAVKWNVLFPLLEATGLEEDETMAERWAALLSSAADPAKPEVPPSFPEVLKQLSPLDALTLDLVALHRVTSKLEDLVPSPVLDEREGVHADLEIASLAEILRRRYAVSPTLESLLLTVANLDRLRLVEVQGDTRRPLRQRLSATVFGLAFVRACSPAAF